MRLERSIRNRSLAGFSLIEMLVASALVLLLSATSYRILSDQGKGQKDSVWGQKKNTMMLSSLDRFKTDVMKINPNWARYDISSIYPAQGYGLGENFYVNTLIQDKGLNDAVTFLRRNYKSAELYSIAGDVHFPAPTATATALYDDWITFNEPTTIIKKGNWVLLFEPGKSALGIVTDVDASGPARIKIRQPNDQETVATHTNIWGRSSGYVTKLGVVPMSCDWTGSNTADTEDDTLLLQKNSTKVEILDSPVSYELDWATSDMKPHSHGNTYVLDSNGEQKKVLVRTEYTGSEITREYVGEAENIGITYDALISTAGGIDSLSGYTEGEIEKNIGRESTTSVQFVNLAVAPDSNEGFISTSRILAMRMFISDNLKVAQGEEKMKYNEIHIAIDPSLDDNRFQEDGKSVADNSKNLGETSDMDQQQIGTPLYFRQPGSDKVNVISPVSYMYKAEEGFKNGKLVITDEKGCPVTSSSCSPDAASEITFKSSSDNSYFYPNSMIQINDDPTKTKILVGGFGVTVDNSVKPAIVTRAPAMASIEIPADKTLADVMKDNAASGSSGTLCSLANCNLQYLNTSGLSGDERFKDTAGGFATDKDNNVYVASLTHDNSADDKLSIYKTGLSGTSTIINPLEEVVVDSTSTFSKDRVISAIAQSPVTIGDNDYLPMCLSRTLEEGGTAEDDGKLLLYNLKGTDPAPIEIGTQNFKCTSLSVVDKNLLIGGKLVFQVMQHEEMESIVNGESSPLAFYTDEIASVIDATGTKYYAESYKTLPSVYSDPVADEYQQVFGWGTGLSAQPISGNEFGIVMGNRAMIAEDSVKGPVTIDQQDFTTLTVTFGGMEERILASIDTFEQNLNKSVVTVQYGEAQSSIPRVLLPGVFYFNSLSPRQTLAPLPTIASTMDGSKWLDFYIDYMDMHDIQGGTAIESTPKNDDDGGASCSNSYPPTCGGGGDGKGGGGKGPSGAGGGGPIAPEDDGGTPSDDESAPDAPDGE